MPLSPASSEGAAFAKIGEEPGGQDPRRRMPQHGDEHLEFWIGSLHASPPKSFVYVVQAEGDPPIKVGRATDVRKRVASLQTGNPRPLQLLHVIPGAAELEWQLHYRIRDCRLIGEWFAGDQINGFLDFVSDLADFFVAGWLASAEIPDFRRFRDGWAHRRQGQAPARITFTDPDPAAVESAEKRRRIEAEPREFIASERDKREFAAAHAHPTFTPHKSRN
jgi:hypothetical protein